MPLYNLGLDVVIVFLADSSDVRKSALLSLIKKAREEPSEVWDEYFNAVLLILLETVTDDDVCELGYCSCRFVDQELISHH